MEEGLSAVARLLAPVQPYCSLISAHDVGNREFLDPVHDSVATEEKTSCSLALFHMRSLQVPPCLAAVDASRASQLLSSLQQSINGRRISGRRFPSSSFRL